MRIRLTSPTLPLFVLLAVGACSHDDAGPQGEASAPEFCQRVVPAVDAWLERAREAHPTPEGAEYGGTVVAASIAELPDGMNSAVAVDYQAVQHQQFVNLMTLVQYDADLRLRPYLARSWEVSDDGTVITFHLRDDVVWHDGEPTDAHDVAFTYRLVTNPEAGFPNTSLWADYDTGPDGIEVLDDHTFRVRLTPHADFFDPWRIVGILPEHLLRDADPTSLRDHPFGTVCPVGNGPFVFREHRPNERWTFAANPAFPDELGGRPRVDRYVYRVIPEQATLLNELLTGGVHLYIAPRPSQADRILAAEGIELKRFPFRTSVFVAWNSRRPQFADARVRRALTMAVNREALVDALLEGYGTVAHTSVPPFHRAYDPRAGALPYDPDGARALLDEAGWRDRDGDGIRENADGVPFSITIKANTGSTQRQTVAEYMQAQLAEVGIDARPEVLEFTTLLEQINTPDRREFDGVVMAWVTEFKVDDTDRFRSDKRDEPFAWSGTQNARLDDLLDTLRTITDAEASLPLWQEYQRLLGEEQPYTFFYFPDRLNAHRAELRNVEMDARGDWVGVTRWSLSPSAR